MARTRWTVEKVGIELARYRETIGVECMPTARQLRTKPGGNALAAQVSRRGGFDFWADRLGLERSSHDSRTGWEWEAWVADAARGMGCRVVESQRVKSPWDLQINGHDVNVKFSSGSSVSGSTQWTWRIAKPAGHTVDFYVMVGLVGKLEPFVLVRPAGDTPLTCTTARGGPGGVRGKHVAWLDRWDLLSQADTEPVS